VNKAKMIGVICLMMGILFMIIGVAANLYSVPTYLYPFSSSRPGTEYPYVGYLFPLLIVGAILLSVGVGLLLGTRKT
jgi:hypothetical protein